jgi:hypothetical protein
MNKIITPKSKRRRTNPPGVCAVTIPPNHEAITADH